MMSKALHVFLVQTRFQALIALLIAENQAQDDALIVYEDESLRSFLARFPFIKSVYVKPRQRYRLFARQRNHQRRLNAVLDAINTFPDFQVLNFYCAKIHSSHHNFFINFLRKKLPTKIIHFNIIADGQSNFRRIELTDSIRQDIRAKKHHVMDRLFGLNYYAYERERFGIDDDIISKIYLLPNSPHEYDASRVVAIPLSDIKKYIATHTSGERKALVIGGKHVDRKLLTPEEERSISKKISDILKENNITHVDYLKHPAAKNKDLFEPWYQLLETDAPAEMLMLENQYALVLGISSTSLFVGRMLCGDACSVYSVGLDKCLDRYPLAPYIKKAFSGMGITLVN
jgi:hypothetical protein